MANRVADDARVEIFGKLKYFTYGGSVSSTVPTGGEQRARDIWLAYMHSVVGDTIDLRIRVKEVEQWYYDSRGESAILAAYQLSQIGMHRCANSREGRAILLPLPLSLSLLYFLFFRVHHFQTHTYEHESVRNACARVYVCKYLYFNEHCLPETCICIYAVRTIRHIQT